LRPYHTTLGRAAGPTCSKILAPPLYYAYDRREQWRDRLTGLTAFQNLLVG